MQLKEINDHLTTAFNAIEHNNRFQACMSLNSACILVGEFKNDYADAYIVHSNLRATVTCLKREGITRGSKGYLLEQIDRAIQECDEWIKRRAA